MRTITHAALMVLALAVPLSAQRDQRLNQGGQSREALMTQVVDQFMNRYQRQAGLTPEQNDRFRADMLKNMQTMREQQQRERGVLQALEFQMRPGVAANADSVSKLLDALLAARQAQVDEAKAEQRAYAVYLTPVQRAQLAIQWEQLMNRIQQVVRDRMLGRGQGPPQGN